jgi:hypothetical protein
VSAYDAHDAVRLGATANVRLSATKPVSLTIPLARAAGAAASGRLILEIGGITFAAPPPVGYDVYVGLPPGAAPRANDVRHVGSLTFYGLSGKRATGDAHQTGQLIDITAAARAAGGRAGVDVTFVPFALVDAPGAPKPSTDVVIGRIEVRMIPAP